MVSYEKELTEEFSLKDSRGTTGETSLFIKDSSDNWIEYLDYEYFKIVRKQNQVSEFEISIANIEASDKLIVKEFAEVLFLSEDNLILKGRIQKVSYETSYSCNVTGYGMEAKLLDKEFTELDNTTATWNDSKRAQYTNTSAQTIAKELLSSNSDGASPWIIQPESSGLFSTDYGNTSIRFEYANRLKALASLTESLVDPDYQVNYDWWVDQSKADDYDTDRFKIAQLRPTVTKATVSQETFAITGADANCSQTHFEKDITNLANKIDVLGYADGINQLHTSTYNASETYSTLASDITATSTTITLADASDFASSGTIRIMEEQITYTGKSDNNLTGCTRGANSTTARVHKKGVFVEKYVAIASAESGSSIGTNTLMDYSVTDRSILDLPTAELIASKLLLERMSPIVSIRVIPNEPLNVAGEREIGELVTVEDAESGISGDYRIVGITYISDYGNLEMELELSNKTLNFIDQMKSTKEEAEKLSKYMQGATNIYSINESENCDDSHYLNLKFFIPNEAIAINKVLLNFKLKDFRIDAKSVTGAPEFSLYTAGWFSGGRAFNLGNFTTTNNVVSGLNLGTRSFISSISSTSGFVRTNGTWYKAESPTKIPRAIDGDGHVTSWWNTYTVPTHNGANQYSDTVHTGYSSATGLNSYSWTNTSAVTGWTSTTWSYPICTSADAPDIAGTFDRIKISGTVHNGYNETKTPTIYLKREDSIGSGVFETVETYTPTLPAWSIWNGVDYEDTDDYRGYGYRLEITSSTGFNVNKTTSPDSSYILLDVGTYLKSTNDLDYGIYEETLTSPSVDLYTGEDDGSMTKKATYTEDQTEIDLSTEISAVGAGKWANIQFRPNKRMRIEGNAYLQIFIKSI